MAASPLDSTVLLTRLLDDNNPRAIPPRRSQDAQRRWHRMAEYKELHTPVTIYINLEVVRPVCFKPVDGDPACFQPTVVEAELMQEIVDGVQKAHNECVGNEANGVPSAPKSMVPHHPRGRHAAGQVMHYFDSMYVVSHGVDVRLVCHHEGNGKLMAISYCSGPGLEKIASNQYLNVLEHRWYGIKGEFAEAQVGRAHEE